jgi:hypothetical protein
MDMPQLVAEEGTVQVGERLEKMAQNASRLKSSVAESVEDNLHRCVVPQKEVGMVRKTS